LFAISLTALSVVRVQTTRRQMLARIMHREGSEGKKSWFNWR